jgi:hypothetical protein
MTDPAPSSLADQANEIHCIFLERKFAYEQMRDMPAGKRPPDEVLTLKRQRLFVLRDADRTMRGLAGGAANA